MRICPFHGCTETIGDHLFSCVRHWSSLSRQHQQTIRAAYADYVAGNIGVEKLREVQQGILGERGTA
jgi:hypothetical protein